MELFDVKNRRTFLRKCKVEGLRPELLHLGAKVTIYGRQLLLTAYGDACTRAALEDQQQRCDWRSRMRSHAHSNPPASSALPPPTLVPNP